MSNNDLRAQVAKLERANATLKAKSREANRLAKTTAGRIAELETEVARLHEPETRTTAAPKPAKATRRGRPPRNREIEAGDAGPAGASALDTHPVDSEAETEREVLEEHLPGE